MAKYKLTLRAGIYSTKEKWGKVVELDKMGDAWPIFDKVKRESPHLAHYMPRIEPFKNVQDETLAVRCAKSGRLATR